VSLLLSVFSGLLSFTAATSPDLKLVRDALAGEQAAVRALVRRLLPVIRAVVGHRLRRRGGRAAGDLDDYTQDIWLALLADGGRRLLAFDPARGASFEGYVGVVAEREFADRLRREGAKKRGGDHAQVDSETLDRVAGQGGDPEAVTVARRQAEALRAHLDSTLPERGRLVFRYLYVDGRGVAEVAATLGVKTQVVYNWQHRIRKEARTLLAA